MSLSNNEPLIIGLTGGIGSGKSIVSHVFEILGVPVYYSDIEAKKLYDNQKFREKLRLTFGTEVFNEQGIPDKKKIAQIVFNNPEALKKLNTLIHPQVKENFLDWVKNTGIGHPYVIQESAILFEAGFDSLFHKIITVYADLETVIKRVKTRDNINEEEIILRINNQMHIEEKKKCSDFVIMNDDSQLVLPQVLSIHQKLMQLSSERDTKI